jgi:hypothetical protein
VLVELERGDFKKAGRTLDKVDRRRPSIERPIAELVVYLATFDGHRAAAILAELQRTDPLSAQRCQQANLWDAVAYLQRGRAPLRKEAVGAALGRLAIAFPEHRFPRAAAISYDAKVLKKDPAALAATLESDRKNVAEAAKTRLRLETLERNLALTQIDVARLNREARTLLRSVASFWTRAI